MQRYYKTSPVAFENLRCVKWVLLHPKRIFEGIREVNPGGWCYVGRPRSWHIRPRIEVPFPRHPVYAVYLNPNRFVYEWRAERAAHDDPESPVGFRERYGRLTWKSTT